MKKKTRRIEVRESFPYPIELVWRAITDPEALSRWFMKTDFEPVVGKKFQFRAEPMRGWRGYVDCEVLEVEEPHRLRFSWQGMPEHNVTTVTYELEQRGDSTVIRAVHEGFDRSHGFLSGWMLRGILKGGWKKMFGKLLPQVLANGREGNISAAISGK